MGSRFIPGQLRSESASSWALKSGTRKGGGRCLLQNSGVSPRDLVVELRDMKTRGSCVPKSWHSDSFSWFGSRDNVELGMMPWISANWAHLHDLHILLPSTRNLHSDLGFFYVGQISPILDPS